MSVAPPPGADVVKRPTFGRTECHCVRWHRPVPAEDEGHLLVPTAAPFFGSEHGERVWLCPTTRSAVNLCIRVHLYARDQDRDPTALELRPFVRYVRRLAQVAMDALGPQADMPLEL